MQLNKSLVASFDVDAQNCFTPLCPNECPVPEGNEIVTELNAQAEFASYRLGSKDAHSPQAIWVADETHAQLSPICGDNVDVYWNQHAVPGTKGFELLEGLPHPSRYDFFVWKGIELDMHPYGACFHDLREQQSTGVIEYLRSHQVTAVIVGGLALDYCVKITAMQLVRSGFLVLINLGACRSVAYDSECNAVQVMRDSGIQFVDCANELSERIHL